MPRDSDKLDSRCNVLKARINNCKGNVLIDSGAQISLISEKFINKNIVEFKKVPILPINNTTIETATNEVQKINKQAYITISSQGMELETPVLVVKDLIYDVIIATDTLKKINAIIDFSKK